MNPNNLVLCDEKGWLVPDSVLLTDHAWKRGTPRTGCSNLTCVRCGRTVLSFQGQGLTKPFDDRDWLDIYDGTGFGPYLGPPIAGYDYRLYLCGCRARANGGWDTADTLTADDDLPWRCAGHPAMAAEEGAG